MRSVLLENLSKLEYFFKMPNLIKSPTILSDFFNQENISWKSIKHKIYSDNSWREKILWELHFERSNKIETKIKRRIVRLLFLAYRSTSDIRFFNEYLFFSDSASTRRRNNSAMFKLFKNNLKEDGTHIWPKKSELAALKFLDSKDKEFLEVPKSKNIKVGLLGSPHFFNNLKHKLEKFGLKTIILFIPHHSNRLVRFLYKNKFLFRFFLYLKNIKTPYVNVSSDYRSNEISAVIHEKSLDIAFHKLGFIIKRNIIDSFPLGVINDHWGPLPEVRGRSSLEYTLLFGFPIIVTTHLITEKVDDGEIISYFNYEYMKKGLCSVKDLKKKIRKTSDERAIRSIIMAISNEYRGINNDSKDGFMFYAMHPWLVKYVDNVILKKTDMQWHYKNFHYNKKLDS